MCGSSHENQPFYGETRAWSYGRAAKVITPLFPSLNIATAPATSEETILTQLLTECHCLLWACIFWIKLLGNTKSLSLKSTPGVWKCFETLPKSGPQLKRLTQQWRGWQQTVGWLQRPPWLSARQSSDWQPPLPPVHPVRKTERQRDSERESKAGDVGWNWRAWRDFSYLSQFLCIGQIVHSDGQEHIK